MTSSLERWCRWGTAKNDHPKAITWSYSAMNKFDTCIDTISSGGRLVFHLFGALAEFGHNLIHERSWQLGQEDVKTAVKLPWLAWTLKDGSDSVGLSDSENRSRRTPWCGSKDTERIF